MRYVIAGIPIEIPGTLLAGHFAKALTPFASTELTPPESAANVDASADPAAATSGPAAGSAAAAVAALVAASAGDSDRSNPGPHGNDRRSDPAESYSKIPADCSGPELLLRPGICPPPLPGYRELDSFDFADADADCRFGLDPEGYLLEMAPRSGSAPARFRKEFLSPVVTTDFTLAHNPALLRFGLWTAFNLAAIRRQCIAFHSSVISYRKRGILFLGESGTGKSTHTRLWREHISGAALLNDDSPIIRICDGRAWVCGSPWSGKTPCYRNIEQPVAAIVRLSQAPHNLIRRLPPLEALGALLPSCPPAFARDERLQDLVCDIVSELIRQVPVFHLECLPDADAAQLACKTIFEA